MVVDRTNLYQRFGSRGSLESLAGIQQLVATAKARDLPHDTADVVCELAFSGNQQAAGIIRELTEYLAAAVVNTVALIDPEIVVFGGDLADLPHAEELFVRPVEALMRRHVINPPIVRLSQLQGDAALHGAMHAALGDVLASAGRSGGYAAGAIESGAELMSVPSA
jgi:predicted NBD/HSP70 family sugar kinase